MPQTCTICNHPSREGIEAAILVSIPLRNIAKQFDVGYSAVYRHKPHVSAKVARAVERKELKSGDRLLSDIDELWQESTQYVRDAKQAVRYQKTGRDTWE